MVRVSKVAVSSVASSERRKRNAQVSGEGERRKRVTRILSRGRKKKKTRGKKREKRRFR